jgi:L-arabinokinase
VTHLTIAFYISGHGFGHASRSIELINALIDRQPGVRVFVRSQAAGWLFARSAHPSVVLSPIDTDTGVVQLDSLRLDAAATIQRAREFMTSFDQRVDAEVRFLRAHGVAAVIADLPPLGIAAAHAAGVPAIAYGNFTWDWIYAGYEGGDAIARAIGAAYRHTTLALRLPMWGGFETMTTVRDIPFAARHSTKDPADTRRALGLPRHDQVVLTSFGGYGISGVAKPSIPGYRVLWPGDIDEPAMYEKGYRYEDLVRAVDVVVSKPGYGIISECIANDTALLYTSRGDFREYPVLVREMPRYLRCEFISHEHLFSGRWQTALDRLLSQGSPPVKPETNGAQAAVELLLSSGVGRQPD